MKRKSDEVMEGERVFWNVEAVSQDDNNCVEMPTKSREAVEGGMREQSRRSEEEVE